MNDLEKFKKVWEDINNYVVMKLKSEGLFMDSPYAIVSYHNTDEQVSNVIYTSLPKEELLDMIKFTADNLDNDNVDLEELSSGDYNIH